MKLPHPVQSRLGIILVQAAQTQPEEILVGISDIACKIFSVVSLHGNPRPLAFDTLVKLAS